MKRTPEQLQADYEDYCEAKQDIGEEPLGYQDWMEMEVQAESEWDQSN